MTGESPCNAKEAVQALHRMRGESPRDAHYFLEIMMRLSCDTSTQTNGTMEHFSSMTNLSYYVIITWHFILG